MYVLLTRGLLFLHKVYARKSEVLKAEMVNITLYSVKTKLCNDSRNTPKRHKEPTWNLGLNFRLFRR